MLTNAWFLSSKSTIPVGIQWLGRAGFLALFFLFAYWRWPTLQNIRTTEMNDEHPFLAVHVFVHGQSMAAIKNKTTILSTLKTPAASPTSRVRFSVPTPTARPFVRSRRAAIWTWFPFGVIYISGPECCPISSHLCLVLCQP